MGKEQRLIPGDEFSSEHWDTGYWISESDIIDMLHSLHKFNLLNDKALKLMAMNLGINLMDMCKENGITYDIIEKVPNAICPNCKGNVLSIVGDPKTGTKLHKCIFCGNTW